MLFDQTNKSLVLLLGILLSGTMKGPMRYAIRFPKLLEAWLIDVAVVLWLGGNQATDKAGGMLIMVTPAIPLKMAPIWQEMTKYKLFFDIILMAVATTTNAEIKIVVMRNPNLS